MIKAHSNSKTRAERLSQILWGIGIENHIGYDKKPFSRFKRVGWMYRYVVRLKLESCNNVCAEFRSDWGAFSKRFDTVIIYNTNGDTIKSSDRCSALVEVQDIIRKVIMRQHDKNNEPLMCLPRIEYTKTKFKKARA